MKRIIILFLTILAALPGFGQAATHDHNAVPAASAYSSMHISDPVFGGSSSNTLASAERYWENEVKENPDQPASWLNYYKAVRFKAAAMKQETFFRPKLDSIETQMAKQVAGSFEQLFVHYWNGNHDVSRYSSLEKAYRLRPANPEVLRQLTGYNLVAGKPKAAGEFAAAWERTGDMPATLLPYAYNVLQSVPQGAVLITNGELDTYPLLQQQWKNGVRQDVAVLCIALSARAANRAAIFRSIGLKLPANDSVSVFDVNYIRRVAAANPGKKFYLAATVDQQLIWTMQSELYLTGLAFRYSTTPVDNLEFLKENVGEKMKLGDVGNASGGSNYFDLQTSKQLHMNYVLPLILAARQYELAGDKAKAETLREKARTVAQRAGKEKDIKPYLGE